ncbi:MAG TPA: ABC transporter ATP-binding protein [Verrucomicrobiales bacterium]|jgi:oligopeptide/dipeptide ABC transporter ATP-binding protein|nr:ABC transporter ATP-binding protein [Verrucomicrobiales bacterium]
MSLLQISGLRVYFPVKGGVLNRTVASCRAVDGVSLSVGKGETLGLIGESGCGKTTLGKTIVGLNKPVAGSIRFEGQEIAGSRPGLMSREMQMIFQDPAESLNPRMTVGAILEEPFIIHQTCPPGERGERVAALLHKVGLPASAAGKFPFEFSGGQRQRIGIARALALQPQLIVCDEPVSALDVSVQSQVLNLMLDLQREFGMSYLFISHNLAVVRHISDRIAIMYLGKIVELGSSAVITTAPRHAYTKTLLSAIPKPDPSVRPQRSLPAGDVPSPINPPPGCAFGHRMKAPRYQESIGRELGLREIGPNHWVSDCPCCVEN